VHVHDALRTFHTINLVAFLALGAIAFVTWRRRRDRASVWAAAAFGSLELFVTGACRITLDWPSLLRSVTLLPDIRLMV